MEIVVKDLKTDDSDINFTIKSNKINGIYGNTISKFIDILNFNNLNTVEITIEKAQADKTNFHTYLQTIVTVPKHLNSDIYKPTVYETIYFEIRNRNISLKNPKRKIIESLKVVGLNNEILLRNVNTLSSSEKKLLSIAISLLSNPEVLTLVEPFKNLDKQNTKKLVILLEKIKDKYKKTIVIISKEINIIYKYCEHVIITKNNKVILEGENSIIYKKINILRNNNIKVPEIIEFSYIVNKSKKAKLDYHKDIRDIIKDIYKHV